LSEYILSKFKYNEMVSLKSKCMEKDIYHVNTTQKKAAMLISKTSEQRQLSEVKENVTY
jgi:hypothetical protein